MSFELNFNREVTEPEVKKLLDGTPSLQSATVISVDGNSARVDVSLTQSENIFREELAERLAESDLALSEPFPAQSFVDPTTAAKHKDDAVAAVLVSLLFQIIYIYFRFHGAAFGFAAVLALVHDVLITLGAIAFFGSIGLVEVKISLPIIAAVLTLIGYSMNDTIVVFDRIRENLGKGNKNLSEVIDLSVNQTMARSVRTALTTFLVVLILFIVNYGAASSILEGFAFVLMVGVVTGTYSSVFVASPLLLFLPWHFLRGRAGIFWVAVTCGVFGMVGILFTDVISASWYTWTVYAALAFYPVYFLIDLVRWLFIPDPDRALNRVLRSNGAKI
jgi:SecD/SecF fusion protein